MSFRLLPRCLRYICVAMALALVFLFMAGQSLTAVQAARQQPTGSDTYVVNSTADTSDGDLTDGMCLDLNGNCTLRAAIMQANFTTGPQTITLPAGVYLLNRTGYDDAALLGDLDIFDRVTIQGAGSNTTIIDGNGAITNDRVFQIINNISGTVSVSLSGMTIRNGRAMTVTANTDTGGAISTNASLTLSDVRIEGNTAYQGGGVYVQPDLFASYPIFLSMNNVLVEGNSATHDTSSNGGGLYLAANVITLTNTIVHANFAQGDGGGVWGGPLFIRDSSVYNNAAHRGGGLMLSGDGSTVIEHDEIYSNTADLGGGIEADMPGLASVTVRDSYLHNNHAASNGGAIENLGTLVIYSTTLQANTAITNGGGLNNGGPVHILQTTLRGNSAQYGGGIYHFSGPNNPNMLLDNTTLNGNIASRDGGGLYADGRLITLHNVTIADNQVLIPIGIIYDGVGGGLYASSNVGSGSTGLQLQNTLLADDTHRYQNNPPMLDDCYAVLATLYSLGHNLIEANACLIGGTTTGNILGQDPSLGPLQNNGGPTLTQAPLHGSPAIDHGDNAGCPAIDQRGWHRPIGLSCDIGAVEVGPYMYLPLIRR